MLDNKLFISFSATDDFDDCNYSLKYIVRQAVLATLEYEGVDFDTRVSVTFCDNKYIKEINKEYRNKDCATDVLSFPMYDFETEQDPILEPDGYVTIGDIVLSLERAKEQAAEIGNSFEREVAFLVIHSTLHLLGYDHERSRKMRRHSALLKGKLLKRLKFKGYRK